MLQLWTKVMLGAHQRNIAQLGKEEMFDLQSPERLQLVLAELQHVPAMHGKALQGLWGTLVLFSSFSSSSWALASASLFCGRYLSLCWVSCFCGSCSDCLSACRSKGLVTHQHLSAAAK